ncbi:hypothetical protein IPC563_05335 [Pseudomonas aeruginosa]|uniref:hypothetical protein n=1 Tax=Pseudomonas aeruginosa TaxID=287 RepID=UPI000F52DE6E|nr:hypothetical protein [Pseudomonas aeruginosa]RPZ37433.1 hypothetical protein IPC563_05335 [Pseudomonas aeruginosa]RUG83081.1 hypothetical protein IPC561_05355 [Pseudomonas aeruginosa]RUG96558.1 hypothetical protein IPC562_05785 [Pseudomonas aeruginosa]
MNDRELLELAARAAGIPDALYLDCVAQDMYHPRDGEAGIEVNHRDTRWSCLAIDGVWNPLTDDGDALRLAVKLGLTVDIDLDESWTEIYYTAEYQDKEIREGHGGGTDPYGATRLAIVRAAAEIGKSM